MHTLLHLPSKPLVQCVQSKMTAKCKSLRLGAIMCNWNLKYPSSCVILCACWINLQFNKIHQVCDIKFLKIGNRKWKFPHPATCSIKVVRSKLNSENIMLQQFELLCHFLRVTLYWYHSQCLAMYCSNYTFKLWRFVLIQIQHNAA